MYERSDYQVVPIPAFTNNYIWLCINKRTGTAIVVDPGDGLSALEGVVSHKVQVSAIFITHHHLDHSAGIEALTQGLSAQDKTVKQPIPVYGPKQEWIPAVTHQLSHFDTVHVPDFEPFNVMCVPGHTKGHIAYYNPGIGILFCGDTLFAGGCGRLFEGTPERLLKSLQQINALPADTKIYPAHEYTQKNLAFALTVEPQNLDLQKRYQEICALRQKNLPTAATTLSVERKTNPFLRTASPAIIRHVSTQLGRRDLNEVDIFATLRGWKDSF